MTAETPSSATAPSGRRTWLILAVVVLAAIVAFAAMRRRAPQPAAADCDKQPAPSAFQVASCDEGGKPAAPAKTAPAAH